MQNVKKMDVFAWNKRKKWTFCVAKSQMQSEKASFCDLSMSVSIRFLDFQVPPAAWHGFCVFCVFLWCFFKANPCVFVLLKRRRRRFWKGIGIRGCRLEMAQKGSEMVDFPWIFIIFWPFQHQKAPPNPQKLSFCFVEPSNFTFPSVFLWYFYLSVFQKPLKRMAININYFFWRGLPPWTPQAFKTLLNHENQVKKRQKNAISSMHTLSRHLLHLLGPKRPKTTQITSKRSQTTLKTLENTPKAAPEVRTVCLK